MSTLAQIILEVDSFTPNYLSNAQKTAFINRVEGRVRAEVMQEFNELEIQLITGQYVYPLNGIANENDVIKVMFGSISIEKVDVRTNNDNPYYILFYVDEVLNIRFNNCSLSGVAKIITQLKSQKLEYVADSSKELLIPSPYDDVYVHFLTAMIYLHSKDYEEYNVNMSLYNNSVDAFMTWYQKRKPKPDYVAKGWW